MRPGWAWGSAGHALLGAVLQRPDSGGVVLTGRVSLAAQPWLADHRSAGWCCFRGPVSSNWSSAPPTRPVRKHRRVDSGHPVGAAAGQCRLQVQVVVGAAGDSGTRAVSVYSRREESDAEWVLHAQGTLGVAAAEPSADLSEWPPAGAERVDIVDGYARLAERGHRYGPAFQGLDKVWRRGQEVFAEAVAAADAGVAVDGLGIHPALLDAVLHAAGLAAETGDTTLPFCWRNVSLHAGGAGRVRARLIVLADRRDVAGGDGRFRGAGADGGLADDPPGDHGPVERRDGGRRAPRRRPAGGGVVAAFAKTAADDGSAPPPAVSWEDFCAAAGI